MERIGQSGIEGDRRDELVLHQLLAQGGFILQARFAQLQIRGGICLPFLKDRAVIRRRHVQIMTDIVFHHIRDLHFPLYAIAIGDGQRITGRKTKVHRQLLCDERTVVTQRKLLCIAAVAKRGEVREIIKIRRHDDRDRTVFSIIADRDGALSDADGFFDLGIVLQTLQGVSLLGNGRISIERDGRVEIEDLLILLGDDI